MTSSAPIEPTSSAFPPLHTPVTCAPKTLASWTAYVPTPPPAPITSTDWPGRTRPASRRPCRAVTAEIGTAAACSYVNRAGLAANRSCDPVAYSAYAPVALPYTSSPGRKRVTPAPTASTRPARSIPGIRVFGRRSPKAARAAYGSPAIRCQTPWSTPAAWTRTSTSPAPGLGTGTSSTRSTSTDPYRSWTIAFMTFLLGGRGTGTRRRARRRRPEDRHDDHMTNVKQLGHAVKYCLHRRVRKRPWARCPGPFSFVRLLPDVELHGHPAGDSTHHGSDTEQDRDHRVDPR